MAVAVDAISELRDQVQAAALDHTLDPADREAKLAALRDQVAPLLGEIDRRRADARKLREADDAARPREVMWARQNATIREELIELGEFDAEQLDAMGVPSHEELDRLDEEGLLEEAVLGMARHWEEALHPRAAQGRFGEKLGGRMDAPTLPKREGAPAGKRESTAVHRLRVGDTFEHAGTTRDPLTVKRVSGAGVVAHDDQGRAFDLPRHAVVSRHVDPAAAGQGEHDDRALRALADYHAAKAERSEPATTSALKAAAQAEGGHLAGTENRLKPRASTVAKLRRMRDTMPLATDEERAAAVADSLRYTAVFPGASYNQGVERTLGSLEKQGFKRESFQNYWGPGDYNGLHVGLSTPDGGHAEVQFHTPESLAGRDGRERGAEAFKAAGDAHERWGAWQQLVDDAAKVPKPKGAEELGATSQPGSPDPQADYRGHHEAPPPEAGASLDDPSNIYPEDIYSPDGGRLYGSRADHPQMTAESMAAIRSARGKPDATVTVHRAVPKGSGGGINPGDWVTPSRRYADQHGHSNLGGDHEIVSKKVPAGELYTEGNSIHEWGWHPKK